MDSLSLLYPKNLAAKIFEETPDVPSLLIAGLIVLVAFLAGWALERYLIRRLRRLADRQEKPILVLLAASLRRVVWIWLVLWGVGIAQAGLPLREELAATWSRLSEAIFLMTLGVLAARLAAHWFQRYAERVPTGLPSATIFANLLRGVILTLFLLMAIDAFGVSIAPLLTGLGVGGLAVALALQPTLANLLAGLQILTSRQLRPGDFIELEDGRRGYVQDITWRTTTIRELTNSVLVIPNDKLANATIVNHYLPDQRVTIRVPVGVHYDSDLEQVERVTLEVLRELAAAVPGVDPEFEPQVRFRELGPSSIDFVAVFQVREAVAQFPATHELIKRLIARYRQEGIEIPYPIRNVYFRSALSLQSEETE